jgi:hypothetical protein
LEIGIGWNSATTLSATGRPALISAGFILFLVNAVAQQLGEKEPLSMVGRNPAPYISVKISARFPKRISS